MTLRLEGGGPPYSTGLTPTDFHLFGPLKMRLAGALFAAATDVKQAATSWLQTLDIGLLNAGDTSLDAPMGEVVIRQLWLGGSLVCTICYHVYIAVGTKLSASERLWSYFFETSL
jgi:hypothetical protein